MVNDPIADLLTRIRNALQRNTKQIILPSSRMIESIAKILKDEGYILDYNIEELDKNRKQIAVSLKFDEQGNSYIHEINRVSKPGLRIYNGYRDIPSVLDGIGINIFSTPKGVMTGKDAKEQHVGGEYLCEIW